MGDLIALRALVDAAANATEQTPEQRDREAKADACERRRQRLERIEMPDPMRAGIIADTLVDTFSRTAVRGWYQLASSPLLALSGSTGRGKTVAALGCIADHGGHYTGARAFLRVSRSTWSEDVAQVRVWMSCALLVIDDLGRESDAAEMSAALLDVIDERPSIRRRTILITNFDKATFLQRYPDERLRSRLAQLGSWVGDKGDDMRRGKR